MSVGQCAANADSSEPASQAEKLMDQITVLLNSPQRDDTAWRQVLPLREALGKCGPEAVEKIAARIDAEEVPAVRSTFTYALGEISGEPVDRILLRLFCSEPSVASMAGMQLIQRGEKYGPFTFEVLDEQIDVLLTMVRDRPVYGTDHPLRILAMCARNDPAPRVRTAIHRFIREVRNPTAAVPVAGSSVSPRVFVLNKFLLAFKTMRDAAVPELEAARARADAARDEELYKWFTMALGICGDQSVADYLEQLVLHETDRYIRCQAIACYAQAAGKDAEPLLRELLNDTTETEFHCDWGPGRYIIANAARDALARLARQSE